MSVIAVIQCQNCVSTCATSEALNKLLAACAKLCQEQQQQQLCMHQLYLKIGETHMPFKAVKDVIVALDGFLV